MRSLVFAAIMMIATSAHAAEFFILPGTKTLLMMGETRPEDVQRLRENIENEEIDTLILKGPGGSLEAGYAMADIVLENNLTIIVPEGTDCASACSLIFAAGGNRIMEKGSRLGFHLPFVELEASEISSYCRSLRPKVQSTKTNPGLSPAFVNALSLSSLPVNSVCLMRTYQKGLQDIRRLSKILVRDGISEDILELVIDTPSNTMAWVSPIEAKGYGLVGQ